MLKTKKTICILLLIALCSFGALSAYAQESIDYMPNAIVEQWIDYERQNDAPDLDEALNDLCSDSTVGFCFEDCEEDIDDIEKVISLYIEDEEFIGRVEEILSVYISDETDGEAIDDEFDVDEESETEITRSDFEFEEGMTLYTTDEVYVRNEPSGSAEIIQTYNKNTEITAIDETDGWIQAEDGWVNEKYLSPEKVSEDQINEIAKDEANDEDDEFILAEPGTGNSDTTQVYQEKVQNYQAELDNADFAYEGDRLFVTINSDYYGNGFYYLTHVIVDDPEDQMHEGLSYDCLGGTREATTDFADRTGAVLATNGSYFSYDTGEPTVGGLFISDGKVVKGYETNGYEMCLTMNGRLFTPEAGLTADDLMALGVTDSWGTKRPTLIADGECLTFGEDKEYPRCAYGMVELGEYYIITAGTSDYNGGLTQKEMQEIFYDLGCTYARPLDEGGSATLVFEGELINTPAAGEERPVVDFVYFTD